MKWKIINPVTPRFTPSMFQTKTLPELQVGYQFDSDVVTTTRETIEGKIYDIVFIQLPSAYWVPKYLEYKLKTFVEEIIVTPPPPTPTTDPYKPKKVTVENDGGVYVATDFTKV